ncbi:MAG: 2-oxoacid:acceptor oxidoreductase family protein [Candidatus Ranarchaeia archaeon]
MTRLEIRFAGTGGQGIISAAILLGQAIALYDNRYVTQTQSYGPESRGSAARADVVVSKEPIDFPKVIVPDILIIMSQAAFEKYIEKSKSDSTVIIDQNMVEPDNRLSSYVVYRIPAIAAGETISRKPLVANIVMLGALAAIKPITTLESLEFAIKQHWPRLITPNLKALQLGYKLGRSAKTQPDHTAQFPLPVSQQK